MQDNAPKTHRHAAPPRFEHVGYSDTAPAYHLERCMVGRCKVTRITYCPHRRGDREANFGLKPICSVCDKED